MWLGVLASAGASLVVGIRVRDQCWMVPRRRFEMVEWAGVVMGRKCRRGLRGCPG